MKKTIVKVAQSPEPDEIVERSVLAQSIVEISRGIKRLQGAGITREAVIVLAQHNCKQTGTRLNKAKPNLATVRAVVDSLGDLEKEFVA